MTPGPTPIDFAMAGPTRAMTPRHPLGADRVVRGSDGGGKCSPQKLQRLRTDPVVDPPAALLSTDQAGVCEHLQVVAHGRLGQPNWLREIAHTCLPVRIGTDEAQKTEPGRIGKHSESRCQPIGLSLS